MLEFCIEPDHWTSISALFQKISTISTNIGCLDKNQEIGNFLSAQFVLDCCKFVEVHDLNMFYSDELQKYGKYYSSLNYNERDPGTQ